MARGRWCKVGVGVGYSMEKGGRRGMGTCDWRLQSDLLSLMSASAGSLIYHADTLCRCADIFSWPLRDIGTLGPWNLGTLRPWDLRALEPWGLWALGLWGLGTFEAWGLGTFEAWSLGVLKPWDLGILGPWSLGTLGY